MNNYLSLKLRIISFISIILVVLLHSYNIPGQFSLDNRNFDSGFNFFIQFFFSQGIARIAVPIFFCISGYLFFLKFNGTIEQFIQKFNKRAKSLLLPYLLWSIWGVILFFILQLLPLSKNYFANSINNYPVEKILHIIFFNPIPYQLWFLRDLIVIVILSPLIYWLIKLFRLKPILVLFILWLEIFKFNFVVISIESIFYFSIGAYFSIYKNDLFEKKQTQSIYIIVTFSWFLITLLKTILVYLSYKYLIILALHKLSIFLGILSVWSMYDILMVHKNYPKKLIYNISFYSFFIYVFHEPALTIIKSGMSFFTNSSPILSLISYFLNPLIVIIISVFLGYFIKKYTPKFYGLITGGR